MKGKKPLTDKEIAEAHIFPEKLNKAQKIEADIRLAQARQKSKIELSASDRLILRLMQLKFQMEDYLKGTVYDPIRTFAYFLKEYLHILDMRQNDFAKAIQIHETELSNLIGNRRLPSNETMLRLEIHSNNYFPAVYTHRLVEKEKEHELANNLALRNKQVPFVKKSWAIHGLDEKDNDRWVVRDEGGKHGVASARTQKQAVEIARGHAAKSGRGEVRIHGSDGKIRNRDTITPGRSKINKDTKH